jgi:hypothetical protein
MRPGDSWSYATGERPMVKPDPFTLQAMKNMEFTWERTRSFKPRNCQKFNNAILPFKMAYRGTRKRAGPTGYVFYERWLSEEAYMFEKLKGNI